MKKLSKLLILFSSLTFLPLVSCQNEEESTQEKDPSKKNFDDVIFEDKKIEYDGGYHSLAPVNLPINTTVKYLGQSSFSEVGRYEINIVLQKEGYNDRSMCAILNITNPYIKGVTILSHKSVVYDGEDHQDDIKPVFVEEPKGVTIDKFIKSNDKTVTSAINVGVYKLHYIVSAPNYETVHLYSTLEIVGKELEVSLLEEHKDVAFDGLDHKNDFRFNPPSGLKLNYNVKTKSIVNSKKETVKEAKKIDEYTFTFELSAPNYQTKTLIGTMSIFDGTHIKNQKNNIQNISYDKSGSSISKLAFLGLHNDGKLYSVDSKNSEPTLLYNETIKDYKIVSNILFIKCMNDEIKYRKLDEASTSFTKFVDQEANMDFKLILNKYLIYTRTSATEVSLCKVKNLTGEPEVLYSAFNITNLEVLSNKVYFLELDVGNLGVIKSLPISDTQLSTNPSVVNANIGNAINFKIANDELYFLKFSLKSLYEINSVSLFTSNKEVKHHLNVLGSDVEYFIEGDHLFYKYSEIDFENIDPNNLTENLNPTKGIYKHYLKVSQGLDDLLLLDTTKFDLHINSISFFDDQIYFSNKSPKDCHVYRIPSFDTSNKYTLVK